MKFGESHPFADPVSPRDPSGENEAEPTILDKFLNHANRDFLFSPKLRTPQSTPLRPQSVVREIPKPLRRPPRPCHQHRDHDRREQQKGLGHLGACTHKQSMSAFWGKAEMRQRRGNVVDFYKTAIEQILCIRRLSASRCGVCYTLACCQEVVRETQN